VTDHCRDDEDSGATPIEVPHPQQHRVPSPFPPLQTVQHSNGNGKANGSNGIEDPIIPLQRNPPTLDPLPQHPTPLDVAVRYGNFAQFVTKQWPALYDKLASLDGLPHSVADLAELVETLRAEIRIRRASQWLQPLAIGFLLATTFAAILLRR
jgi:hypothetical protein